MITAFKIIAIAFFIALGFLFAGSEMALISLNRYRVMKKSDSGDKKFQALKSIIDDPIRMINTLLIGINLSIIAGSILIHSLLDEFIEHNAALWALLLSSFTYLLIAELIPKTLFHRAPTKMALKTLPFLKISFVLFRPVERYFSMLVRRTIRRSPDSHRKLSKEELKDLLELASSEGSFNHVEKNLVLQTFGLSRSNIKDIMVPMEQTDCIPKTASIEEVITQFRQTQHSRLVVTENEKKESAAGIVTIYDILFSEEKLKDLSSAIRPPVFVKDQITCDKALHLLRSHKSPFLIVKDSSDSSKSIGIVTASDLINHLFGEKLF